MKSIQKRKSCPQNITSTCLNQSIIVNSHLFSILTRFLEKPSKTPENFPLPCIFGNTLEKNLNTTKENHHMISGPENIKLKTTWPCF